MKKKIQSIKQIHDTVKKYEEQAMKDKNTIFKKETKNGKTYKYMYKKR